MYALKPKGRSTTSSADTLTWGKLVWKAAGALWVVGVIVAFVAGLWTGAVIIGVSILLGGLARRYGRFASTYARRVATAVRPISKGWSQTDAAGAEQQRVIAMLNRMKPPPTFVASHAGLMRVIRSDQLAAARSETRESAVEDAHRLLRRKDELAEVLAEMSARAQTGQDQKFVARVADNVSRLEELRLEVTQRHQLRTAVTLEKLRRIDPPSERAATHEALIDAISRMAHLKAAYHASVEEGDEHVALEAADALVETRNRAASVLGDVYAP
jgi:hypothetical protein